MTVAVIAGFQTLLILDVGGNSRIWQDFQWFLWNSSQNSQNFGEIHGFPVMLTKHFFTRFPMSSMGGVDIFWNSPIQLKT